MTITPVNTKEELKTFIQFQRHLYAGSPNYVPPLDKQEEQFFSPNNPMAENCNSELWLAWEGKKIVGRIACIINYSFNRQHKIRQARFTHFDCINEEAVAHQLLTTAESWAKHKGMKEIVGPFGFTNLDKHGLLVEGFDELSCQSSNYNHAYYSTFIESFGWNKQHDWVEREIVIPEEVPERIGVFSDMLKERYHLKVLDVKHKSTLLEYAPALFDLYNLTYAQLYGVSPLSETQKQHLIKTFIPFLHPDLVNILVDKNGKVVAFGITMWSLSKSLKKANGRLFPFGFWYLLNNKRKNPILDLLLIGIHPDYQRKGINAIIFGEIFKGVKKHGITTLETTQNLESNNSIQNLWANYEHRLHKRARLYRKDI